MAVFVRTKRVTDPLDERVKASICGHHDEDHHHHRRGGQNQQMIKSYVSSGSEHEGDNDSNSPCLSHLIHGFLERENDNDCLNQDDDSLSDSDHQRSSTRNNSRFLSLNEPIETLKQLLNPNPKDSFLLHLQSQVSRAITSFSHFRSNKEIFRRNVMIFLRELGYNSGICKTKWENSGGLTAGNYEFIDVINNSDQQRYFIDIDFAGEFEIIRPTVQYENLFKILPRVYIGRSEELKQIVKLMSDATKRSLMNRDLHLSPWRKNRYMQMKWFGPYKRTLNQIPATISSSSARSPSIPPGFEKSSVKCQSIGFNVVTGNNNGTGNYNGRFIIPMATRTR